MDTPLWRMDLLMESGQKHEKWVRGEERERQRKRSRLIRERESECEKREKNVRERDKTQRDNINGRLCLHKHNELIIGCTQMVTIICC